MAVSTLAALATAGTQWAVTAGFTLAMAVKTFAISFALSAVSRALAPKPQIDTATGLSSTVKSPTQPRPILYGRTKTAGTLIYVQTTGDDGKYLHMVQAMAGHEIDAYEEIYIDDKLAWKLGTVQPWFQAKTRFKLYTGNQTTADPDLVAESNEWTDTCVLNDTAYIYLRLEHDSEVFNNGIPNVTAVVRGKKVYNPVKDVTEWTQNPALCIADYINDSKYGLSGIEIDSASLASSISVCEQQVDYTDENSQSSTHERYKLDGYIDTSDKISSNIENMLSSMFGELVYSQGKLHINAGYYTEPALDLDESMMVGDITLQTKQSRRAQYNAVKGVFLSKEENYVLADYPSQISDDYALIDGDPIYLDMTLPFTTDNVRAQRLAKLALGKSRQQRVITVPVNLVGLKIKAGDNIRITNEKLGLNNAVYQVVDYELEFSEQLKVNLVCVETGASLYDWALADQQDFSSGSDVELYDGSAQAPTNLNLTAGTNIKSDGTTATYIDASWTAPADVYFDYFEVTITPSGGSANSFTTKESTHRFLNTDDDLLHSISVRSYNTLGRKSDAITAGVTTGIDEEAPAEPTGFNVTGELNQISLSWVNPSDDDFDKVRIKSSTQSNESTSIVIAELKGDSYIDSGYTGVVTKYYWIQAIDRTGNASNYVYAGTGTTTRLTSDDFSDGTISIDHIDQDFADNLTSVESDLDSILNEQQVVDDKIDLVSTRMLTLATRQDEFTGLMRDAGITVDPNNGTVSIQAVETLRSETDSSFNDVSIELDAQEASINLKASTAYVNNAIASAVLDSADLASLNALEAKIDQAEIDIDANTASIILKADSTTVSGLDVRLSQAEIDVNANEASILLKADQTDFNNLENRVTTAEIDINALDAASITQTVSDSRANTKAINLSAVTSLKDILNQYKSRESTITDLAFARQQIFADVNEQREAIAQAKTELVALIDDNTSSIISEQTARTDADSALATDITALTSTVGDNTASIQTEATARADADTALANDITSIESSISDLESDLTGNATAITNLETRVTTAEGGISSNTASITILESDITDLETDTSANATAITGLTTTVTQNGTDITSNATAITGLSTTVNGHTTSISQNLASINGVKAQYSVTINNNDHVTGFGLVSDIIDGNPTSSFTVNADSFAVGATGSTDDFPFVVYTTDQNINKDGTVYIVPAGTYIQDGFIQNASIGTAQIQNASITNAKINDLSADKITAGTISTSRLSIDGVTLDTNASGQLVISNEGVDTAQIANNAVIEASDAYTAVGISNLANGTKEVQSLTIQATGAPVQIIATARISVNSGNFSLGTVIIKRNGSTIRTQTYSAATNNSANETVILRDLPTAGEVEYTVEVYSNSSSSTLISSRYLQAMETKK